MKKPWGKILSITVAVGLSLTACKSSKPAAASHQYKRKETKIAATDSRPSRSGQSYESMRRELKELNMPNAELTRLMAEASKWIGSPYLYGGTKKSGVDCSGFVMNIYLDALESKLPRSSRDQQAYCSAIKKSDLKPGDLVFFATGSDSDRVSHVGVYIGDGRMVHASSSRGVIITDITTNYYVKHYHSSGRPKVISDIYAMKKNRQQPKQAGASVEKSHQAVATPVPAKPVTSPDDILEDMLNEKLDSIFHFFD